LHTPPCSGLAPHALRPNRLPAPLPAAMMRPASSAERRRSAWRIRRGMWSARCCGTRWRRSRTAAAKRGADSRRAQGHDPRREPPPARRDAEGVQPRPARLPAQRL